MHLLSLTHVVYIVTMVALSLSLSLQVLLDTTPSTSGAVYMPPSLTHKTCILTSAPLSSPYINAINNNQCSHEVRYSSRQVHARYFCILCLSLSKVAKRLTAKTRCKFFFLLIHCRVKSYSRLCTAASKIHNTVQRCHVHCFTYLLTYFGTHAVYGIPFDNLNANRNPITLTLNPTLTLAQDLTLIT